MPRLSADNLPQVPTFCFVIHNPPFCQFSNKINFAPSVAGTLFCAVAFVSCIINVLSCGMGFVPCTTNVLFCGMGFVQRTTNVLSCGAALLPCKIISASYIIESALYAGGSVFFIAGNLFCKIDFVSYFDDFIGGRRIDWAMLAKGRRYFVCLLINTQIIRLYYQKIAGYFACLRDGADVLAGVAMVGGGSRFFWGKFCKKCQLCHLYVPIIVEVKDGYNNL